MAVLLGIAAASALAGCGGGSSTGSSGTESRPASGGPLSSAAGSWPTLLHGASHFGQASVTGPMHARIRWTRRLEGPIVPGPVSVGSVAYVASNAGVLHAIDVASGKDRWHFDGGGAYGADLSTAPTVLADGLILWPGPRQRLYALTPQGRLSWSVSTSGDPLTPAVDQAQRMLVLADTTGRLAGYRLGEGDSPPKHLWSLTLASKSFGNPALGSDDTTYETAGDSLYAVAADGRLRWRVGTPAEVEVSAALSDDGTVVFGSNDSTEYGVSLAGKVRWRHAIGNYTYSSPLTLADHRVVFGNHSGEMTLLDTRDGHRISRDRAHGQIWTSAAVDARGDTYFASRSGGIYGFSRQGRALFALQTSTTFASYPSIAADGTLLVGGDDGVLRAIR